MKKIPTLFERQFDNHKVVGITPNVHEGMEWVLRGEGVATEKIDGSCCAYFRGHSCDIWGMMCDAADALEAAEKRIAELEAQLRDGTISNPERFKIYGYTVKDLFLFADMCKRNDVREADLKQAAWNLELAVRAVMNERAEIVKNTMDEISVRFTPDFEKAFAEMRGEHDEQADC